DLRGRGRTRRRWPSGPSASAMGSGPGAARSGRRRARRARPPASAARGARPAARQRTRARALPLRITLGLVREIVIVDDHDKARETLLGMVEHAGYTGVAFANPAGALARIAEQRPALILLDMMMPEIDGADFLRRLAAIREGAAVPVIIVSAIGHLLQ